MEHICRYDILNKLRVVILFFLMITLLSFETQAQITISQDNGLNGSCVGETNIYTLNGAVSGVYYTWTISPVGINILTQLSSNQVQIQWLTVNLNSTINVAGSDNSYYSLTEPIVEALNPYITNENEVGCQIAWKENNIGGVILTEECTNVCEYSTIDYHAHSMYPSTVGNLSRFEWTVSGGVFSNGLTTLTGSTFPTNLLTSATVTWGPAGTGNITVKEYCVFDCTPVEKTYCMNIIESPHAGFMLDGPASLPPDVCYHICQNHEVNFQDLSTASSLSPILFWEWDFGDNSVHSALQNPSHIYGTPGMFIATLKVTNRCGCVSTYQKEICVSTRVNPDIYCPSVVCENNTAIYRTNAPCNPYTWTIVGGTQQPPQNDPEVTVKWDNIGPDGFGYVSLSGVYCNGGECPFNSTIKVPVILTHGTIIGDAVLCSRKFYHYSLPAWPATNFRWQLVNNSTGTIINSFAENGNEIEIYTGNIEGTFQIQCDYYNTVVGCPGTATFDVNLKIQPVISYPEKSCLYSSVSCNVSNPPAGSGTTVWTVTNPAGLVTPYNIANGVSTITIPGNIFSSVGNYTIKASNPSIFCDPEPVIVKAVNVPPAPQSINGNDPVCVNNPYTYTVDPLPGITTHWIISNGHVSGTTNTTTATGNNVTIIWTNNGSITVYRVWDDLPGCFSPTITRNISKIELVGSVNKTSNTMNNWVCEDGSADFEAALINGVIGETYEWTVVPQQIGSVSSGQGTPFCSVTFNHVGTTSNCYVNCKVTKCGVSSLYSLNVPTLSTTTITSVTNPTPVCSGVAVNYTATTSGAPASLFNWDFGDGTIINQAGSVVSHTFNNTGTTTLIYTVSVQAISSCNGLFSAAYFFNVTVNPQPNASITPGGVTLVCPPTTYSYLTTISSPGTNTYQWYFQQDGSPTQQVIIGATGVSYTITNTPPNVSPVATSSLGQYWAVVTNTFGCSTRTNVRSILLDPNCTGQTCTPVSPAGITNITTALIGCGQIQMNANILGTPGSGGNIIEHTWTLESYGVPYTTGLPVGSFTSSPIYTLTQPGIYQIQLSVSYLNSVPNSPPCLKFAIENVFVPIIADFKWGLVCNGSGNGYNLTLKDFSPVYGNNPVTSWTWKINNNLVGNNSATPPPISMANYLGATITVELTVDNGSGFPCTKTQTIAIPNLPVASFTTNTTNPSYQSSKSCEGREVVFTNTSTPIGSIVNNIWQFGDYTELHGLNGVRVYKCMSGSMLENVSLVITDQYGCTANTQNTITIYENNLNVNPIPNTYSLVPSITQCFGQQVEVHVSVSGGTPNGYQWYNETGPFSYSVVDHMHTYNQGAYWVQLQDANYCYKNISSPTAVVSFIYPVQAFITGNQDACENEPFTLKGPPGVGLTYTWKRDGNIIGSSTQTITQNLSAGIYSYTLSVIETGGCSSVSAAFVVTVHALPQPPSIGIPNVNCISYTLNLVATPGTGSCYNWSDGQTGSNIQVNHGGPYRVWLTDQFGCKNYNDLYVPLAPNTFFWRFPTGCYSYCPEELPKWVDGPSHVLFKAWSWMITNNGIQKVVSPNNGQLGWGNNTVCNPLWLDGPPLGSGSGDYSWKLSNGLCSQESGMMNMERKDNCCKVDILDYSIECSTPYGYYDIQLNIFNNTPGCQVAFYNLELLNASGTTSIASFNSQSPSFLVPGVNIIQATIPINPLLANVNAVVRIEIFCNSEEHCIGSKSIVIPDCKIKCEQNTTLQPGNTKPSFISVLNVIPNPATTTASISYCFTNDNAANSRSILIYDALGRPVAEIKIGNYSGTYNLDVSNYAQGIYFVETRENNNHVLVKRMLINH